MKREQAEGRGSARRDDLLGVGLGFLCGRDDRALLERDDDRGAGMSRSHVSRPARLEPGSGCFRSAPSRPTARGGRSRGWFFRGRVPRVAGRSRRIER